MLTVLLFETPIAVVRTMEDERAIAITRWLLKETPVVETGTEIARSFGAQKRYKTRPSTEEEITIFDSRADALCGEARLAAILI